MALERFEYAGQVALSRFVHAVTQRYSNVTNLVLHKPENALEFWGNGQYALLQFQLYSMVCPPNHRFLVEVSFFSEDIWCFES